ncbi:hypothetical protein AZE42_02187 [Rhizopogon vesiculosus]|uniref:Cytochrome P450 n=1 Tax=Rhizopogon vesiculosus TaxID=180088 RepID=A0A1J8PWG7_9AGAM|nr:hypothetical protein AZE42_02187 [Rhizopogon vesiculosus]
MEKQGQALADRPRMIVAAEMLSGGLGIVTARAGDSGVACPKSAEAYQPLQMSHAKTIVLDTLDNPYDFQSYVITYAATTIMKVAYEKDTPTLATDPEVREVHQSFDRFRKVLHPGAYLVNLIPWLKYLPWYGKELKRGFESKRRLHTSQLNRVKLQISNTDVVPSFAKFALENGHSYGIAELEAVFLAGTFFGAGSATTSVAICTVLMAAACFPEEQAKVQDELDAVIGMRRGIDSPFASQFMKNDLLW